MLKPLRLVWHTGSLKIRCIIEDTKVGKDVSTLVENVLSQYFRKQSSGRRLADLEEEIRAMKGVTAHNKDDTRRSISAPSERLSLASSGNLNSESVANTVLHCNARRNTPLSSISKSI